MISGRSFDATGAVYFDGDSPELFKVVALTGQNGDLRIKLETGAEIVWPEQQVRRISDMAGRSDASLRWTGDPLARLFTPNPILWGALPAVDRRAPPQGRRRLAVWAGAGVVAVAVQVFVLVPLLADQLAVFIPPKGEKALGEATLTQIREILDETGLGSVPVCENENGIAALQKMQGTLVDNAELEGEFTVLVLDHPMVNAFALPGGFIVLFRGLIDAAEKPEQVAAVFAHEMGHVVSRDPTRHALRSAGSIGVLGLLLGDFAGGAAVLFLTEQLINAQYSQKAESGADRFASRVLLASNVSPAALGEFFDHLRKAHGDSDGILAHFMSHPELSKRIEAAQADVPEGAEFTPVLDEDNWAALQAICD